MQKFGIFKKYPKKLGSLARVKYPNRYSITFSSRSSNAYGFSNEFEFTKYSPTDSLEFLRMD